MISILLKVATLIFIFTVVTQKENIPTKGQIEMVDEKILEMLSEDSQESKALKIDLHPSSKLRWNYWKINGISN